MDYQQAKVIRGTKVTDLLATAVMDSPSIREAVKKTVSLKLQARTKGFKEKFDPLNIAKFMTFGSKMGPALLGKLTGRSKKDIEYFTGRLKPIRPALLDNADLSLENDGKKEKQTKSNGSNMTAILTKMLAYQQKIYEDDTKRQQINSNFEKERKMEEEKRHKKLLEAIEKLTNKNDKVLNIELVSAVGGENGLSFLETLLSPGILTPLSVSLTPLILGALPPALLALASYLAEKADINNPGLNPFANVGAAGLKFGNYIDEVTGRSKTLKEEQEKRNEERMTKGDPWERKKSGSDFEQLKSLAPIIQNYELKYKSADEITKKQLEPALVQLYDQRDALIKKIGGVDAPGERIIPKSKSEQLPSKQSDVSGESKASPVSIGESKASPVSRLQPQTTITPMATTDTTNRLNAVSQENVDANLPAPKPEVPSVVNNVSQSSGGPDIGNNFYVPSVRDHQETLRRMIYNSTYVV